MRLTQPLPLVAIAAITMVIAAACASTGAKATTESLTVDRVLVNTGPENQNPLTYFASGHWLYADDLNDTIVYDGKVVAHGHPVTAALSQNGLHYADTLAAGLSVYVDGRPVDRGTYLPEVFAVSDDGATVLYSDTAGKNGAGSIYRNGDVVFHSTDGIGQAVGSADAMHYTAVVSGFPETLVHDGKTVATSGVTGMSSPMISPDGAHYGMFSSAQGGGVTSVDGVAILPIADWGQWGWITDSGHWVILDAARGDAPLVDGVVKGQPAGEAVITDDGQEIAADTVAGAVTVNGVTVATAPRGAWLEIEGSTLYVYDIVTQ